MSTKLGTVLADFTTNLATAIIVGGTSATLQSAVDDDGVALPSGRYFFTLDGANSNKEHLSCDLAGTAISNIKSVSRQGVETVGLARAHRIGCTVTLTDFAHLLYQNNLLSGTTLFNSLVKLGYDADPGIISSDLNYLATVKYVNGVAVAGAPNASTTVKGIVEMSVLSELLAKTPTGATGAALAVSPDIMPSTLLNDYKADTGAANAYAIAPAPAITAYTVGQMFSFKATNVNTGLSTLNVNGLGVKTIKKGSGNIDLAAGDIAAGMIIVVEYDGTNFVMLNPTGNAPTAAPATKFGGTGADGALAITAGVTTIDLAGAAVVVKNYTSISITGTGSLAFINPHANGSIIILRSQGNVTLTSSATPMVDVSGMGAAGGAAGLSSILGTNFGVAGTAGGPVGAGGATPVVAYGTAFSQFLLRYTPVLVGAGGGAGMATLNGGTATAGAGGRGGGGLIIECNGAWNFTTASGISVGGKNGTNGTHTTTGYSSGGGGGAGGFFLALYTTLTANSGTVTVAAGTGGNSANTSGNAAYGGGGGALIAAGNPGTSSTADATKTGGDGAVGLAIVVANTEFL